MTKVFEEEAKKIEAKVGHVDFLLQGTLYPDVIESTSFRGPSPSTPTSWRVRASRRTTTWED